MDEVKVGNVGEEQNEGKNKTEKQSDMQKTVHQQEKTPGQGKAGHVLREQ